MLDFCAEHGISADIDLIPVSEINEAFDRLLKSDVEYRFVIDMATLEWTAAEGDSRGSREGGVRVNRRQQRAGRRPGFGVVARELRLSARTLQRRLAQDGASFQQLIQEARRELARHYLLHSAVELNEAAYLLGHEDAHSFFRAFHGWEGSSPGAWRARHAPAS